MARSISRLARIWFDREGAVVAGAEEVEAAVEAVVVAWTAEMGITVAGVAVAWPAAGVAAGVAVATKAACPPSCVGKTGLRTRDPLGSIMESRAWRMVFLWRSCPVELPPGTGHGRYAWSGGRRSSFSWSIHWPGCTGVDMRLRTVHIVRYIHHPGSAGEAWELRRVRRKVPGRVQIIERRGYVLIRVIHTRIGAGECSSQHAKLCVQAFILGVAFCE